MNILTTTAKRILSGSLNKQLFGVLVGMFAAYSFFIVSTVVAINQRKDTNADVRTTQSNVSELEIKYFNLASSIDMSKATQLGFVDSQTPIFAYVNPVDEKVALVR